MECDEGAAPFFPLLPSRHSFPLRLLVIRTALLSPALSSLEGKRGRNSHALSRVPYPNSMAVDPGPLPLPASLRSGAVAPKFRAKAEGERKKPGITVKRPQWENATGR